MASSGLHSNGYSLVRHVLLGERRGWASTATSPSSAAPSARSCSSRPGSTPRPASRWPAATGTHAMAHVTGGGLAANLARVMPEELARHARARHVDAGADLRPDPRARRRTPARPGGHPQLRRRHGRPARARSRLRRHLTPGGASGSTPGWPARWRPRPAPEAPSSWSASTPVGNDRGPARGISYGFKRISGHGCAGTPSQQVALMPRELIETVREPQLPRPSVRGG